MSPKPPVVKVSEVVRVASRLGFVFDHQKGSHAVYRREPDKARIVVPMHAGKDLRPKTVDKPIAPLPPTPPNRKSYPHND